MAALGKKLRKIAGGRVAFWCPGCDQAHQVGVEPGAGPVWEFNGNGDAPTFKPSVFVNAPGQFHNPGMPSCHSFVTDGKIQFLGDCTHSLAGETVPLPDFTI